MSSHVRRITSPFVFADRAPVTRVVKRSADDERELVAAARRGDVDAFSRLAERYQDRLWGFLGSWVPAPSDREELAQEVLLAAFRGIGRFRGEARFSTWLFQIAVNQARAYRRRAATRPRAVALEVLGEPGGADSALLGEIPLPDEAAAAVQRRERLWALVADLPESWQAALRLRYIEGMTHTEIGEALGVPVGTVKVHLHRARRKLATALVETAP